MNGSSPRVAAPALCLLLATLAGCGTGGRALITAHRAASRPIQVPLGSGSVSVRLIVEPDDGKRRLTGPIRRARHTIDLTMYLLTDRTLIHNLEYAAASGVRVRVLLEPRPFGDSAAAISANQSAYDQLYAADIPVRWTDPRYRLTHQKTMIIDGATAYILTLNYSRSAFATNREFGVVDTDPRDVREAGAIFDADWSGRVPALRDSNLLVSPINSRARILALIARARRSIEIYAEEVQDPQLEAALGAAAGRRVSVRLIGNAGDQTNAAGIARLQRAHIAIHLVHRPYIHAKVILIDGRWAFIGSENISAASLDQNRELGILVANRAALARVHTTFERDWSS